MKKEELIEMLYNKDDKIAYDALKQLENISEKNNEIYLYINEFIDMLNNEKSFIRVRGFILICKNAKWDNKNQINININKILAILEDKKPTSVRQYLKAIQDIVRNKPELKKQIKEKLLNFNYLQYADSMQSLIFNDIDKLIKLIDKGE